MKEVSTQLSLDPLLRKYYQTRTGCVMRALESLLSADATEGEWDERIVQIQGWGSSLDIITGEKQKLNHRDLVRWYEILGQDRQWLLDFLNKQRNVDTPMANAIKNYSVNSKLLGKKAIERNLVRGSAVMLLGERHAANLGYIAPGRFVNISDGMIGCNLRDKTLYDVILFDKLKDSPVDQAYQLTLI